MGLIQMLALGLGVSVAVRAARAFLEGYREPELPLSRPGGAPEPPPFDERDIQDAEFDDLPREEAPCPPR